MIIEISNIQKNATPAVIAAIEKLKAAGGGEIRFEMGEYHFFKDGTRKRFYAISNNTSCDKYMVFAIENAENITIDGGGSVFVFHDVVFPFMISGSRNITIKNFIADTGRNPLIDLYFHDADDDGVYIDIDRAENPFFIKDGTLFFVRESETISGEEEFFSLHEVGCHNVQYLATGTCRANLENLPASVVKCTVSDTEAGVYARYASDSPTKTKFNNKEVTIIADGKRKVDVICIDRSSGVTVENVTVARGIGMGVIAQLSSDITIDAFSTDISYHENARQTLTADSLHFVNCGGFLEIKNCKISETMDDAVNVHGIYTALVSTDETTLTSKLMHRDQWYFCPYRAGDRLEVIDSESFEIVAEFIVDEANLAPESATELVIKGHFNYGRDRAKNGFWVENPDNMPRLHMHHNDFRHFPKSRISGAGEMLVEKNTFCDCGGALYVMDLARYWYESGRVRHLIFRDNTLSDCNAWGGDAFVHIGIDGVSGEAAPKIHKKIEITGNRFLKVTKEAIKAESVEELIIKDNIIENKL